METLGAGSDPIHGQIIAGRYRLLSFCGKGGMGSVWRASDLHEARQCAVKILNRTAPEKMPHLAERFLREAKVATAIDSPNAVRVLDYGVDGELPFIVMELLEGETLAATLRRSGRLTAIETFAIVDQVAKALTRAHEIGVVHRDLKPANIFLSRSSDGAPVAKVLDFGIAKFVDEETISKDLTETGALLGTPHYMSPEQIDGARYVDLRADLWSLAVIAFECITGRRPFQGDGLRSLFLAICVRERPLASSFCPIPPGFDAWFAKCTNTDPAKRCRSAAELAEELARVCQRTIAATERAHAELRTGAAEDDPASRDSLSGSIAIPRFASQRGRWSAGLDGSKQRGEDTLGSPTWRSRLPSFRLWGVLALVVLASGIGLSTRGTGSPSLRAGELPTLMTLSSAKASPVPVPSPRGTAGEAHDAGVRGSAAGTEGVPKAAGAPAGRLRPSSAPRRALPLAGPAASSAPSAEAVPSVEPVELAPPAQVTPPAKTEAWNYGEMLKDRK